MGMKPSKFIFLDALGALIMVPLLLALGYYFGLKIDWVGEVFSRLDYLLVVLAILAGLTGVILFIIKKKMF
jgi:membrane protein DedA with SNARE-associated domain